MKWTLSEKWPKIFWSIPKLNGLLSNPTEVIYRTVWAENKQLFHIFNFFEEIQKKTSFQKRRVAGF